jgi:hypothetical protein
MFEWTVCDPLKEKVIEKGVIPQEAVLPGFREFPWGSMLAKMKAAKENEIHFSPSIGFTNVEDGHSMDISIVDDGKQTVFYLFYKDSAADSATSDLLDQSAETTIEILGEFSNGQYDLVREHFGGKGRLEPPGQKPSWKFW